MAKTKTTTTPPAPPAQPTNRTLVYRKAHPGNRCSYGVAGMPGIAVFDLKLFASGKPPESITLDCDMVVPVVKEKPAPVAKEQRPPSAA